MSRFSAVILTTFLACGGVVGGDAGPDSSADVAAHDADTADADSDASVDVASDAPADTDATPLPSDGGIASISGLVLWLDAEKAVTHNSQGQVTVWADQSGNGNDAKQSSVASEPTFVASAIGGLPALHFTEGTTTGSQLVITDSTTLRWGTGDFLIEVVARFDNQPAGVDTGIGSFFFKPGALYGIILAGNRLPGGNPPSTVGLMARIDMQVPGNGNQVDVTTTYNDGVARNYAFRRAGTTLDLRVNGASVASMTQVGTIDVSAAGINVYLGADDTDTFARLDGDIAEIVAVKGTTSTQDLVTIESTLKAKYGL